MSERSVSRAKQEKRVVHRPGTRAVRPPGTRRNPADEPEKVYDRTIETTLGDLNNNASENNTKLTFKITDVGSDSVHGVRRTLPDAGLPALARPPRCLED